MRVFSDQCSVSGRGDRVRLLTSAAASRAFTIIEIAICLGVIGFALVAIIGILPTGMNVQKENRQETVVNQDASVFLETIRNGRLGVDDLTNYVVVITNHWTLFQGNVVKAADNDYYTATNSSITSYGGTPPQFPLIAGNRIIGVLGTPRYTDIVYDPDPTKCQFRSNYVQACVRAISGNASDKFPQNNPEVTDNSFSYRMVSEIVPYTYYHPTWTNWSTNDSSLYSPTTNFAEIAARSQRAAIVTAQQNNLYDMRLLFRWPLFRNGDVGAQRQNFRTITGGYLLRTNDDGYPPGISNLWIFQSHSYVKPS
jgi:type II secretory pathway pseudopilin PulG